MVLFLELGDFMDPGNLNENIPYLMGERPKPNRPQIYMRLLRSVS